MKTLITTIATVFISLVSLPQKAEAGSFPIGHSYTYHSGYASCGSPIFTKRVIASYDRYHRPVYRYYTLPINKSFRSTRYSSSRFYNRGSSRSNFSRSNFNRGSSRSNFSRSNFNRGSSRSNFSRSSSRGRSSFSRGASSSRSSGFRGRR